MKTELDLKKIGKHIQDLRKEKNMKQKDIANKLHVDNKTISKWENGNIAIDISYLIPLSYILDVSPEEILIGEKPTMSNKTLSKMINKLKQKVFLMSAFIIITTIITCIIFTINVFNNNKIDKYSLISDNSKFLVSGYVLKNGKENNLYIKNIESNEKIFVTEIKIIIDEETISTIKFDGKKELSDLFKNFIIDVSTENKIDKNSRIFISIEWKDEDESLDFDSIVLKLF